MIKALQLIFEPVKTWDAIARKERSLTGVLFLSLMPAILFACILEGWGLVQLGNRPTHLGFTSHQLVTVSPESALRFECGQAVVSLLTVFLLTLFLHLLLRSFHHRSTITASFTVMAYSYGPLLLMQAVDGIPSIPSWICRIAGAVLAAKLFYVGLVRVVRPDPTTALGLYFLGALLLFAFAGISQFVVLHILESSLFAHVAGLAVSR